MSRISGSTVLITGGASGIGLLLARSVRAAGAGRLILLDIDQPRLESVSAELEADGHALDLTDTRALSRLAEALPPVDILVNNAGVIAAGQFDELSPGDIDRTMDINARAPMHLTRLLLPGMIARGRGHIVNIASAASMVPNPGMAVYVSSKFALFGWSDSIRLEQERRRTGVRVTTVMPYYIDTGMFDGVRSPLIPLMKPEVAARRIVRAIERDRAHLRMPWIIKTVPFLQGVLPHRATEFIAERIFGIHSSMDTFRGRDRTS